MPRLKCAPRSKRLRFAQPPELPVDPDKHLLKYVFREVPVLHYGDDVPEQRFLNTLEQLVQGLAAARLCL